MPLLQHDGQRAHEEDDGDVGEVGSIDDPLTALEIADGYHRLRGRDYTPSCTARMASKSRRHVADMLLADAEPELHERVRSGQTASATAIAAVQEFGHQSAAEGANSKSGGSGQPRDKGDPPASRWGSRRWWKSKARLRGWFRGG